MNLFIFLCCIYMVSSLDSLGDRIRDEVQRSLLPLQGLGERIQNSVQQSISQSNNFQKNFNRELQNNLRPLENLGENIAHQVEQSLEPVRAMQIQQSMKNGLGGITIASYLPNGKTFTIKNGLRQICDGRIDETTGECSGNLADFEIKEKSDFCYLPNYSLINNEICVYGTGQVSISVVNNQISCTTNDDSMKVWLTTLKEYRRICPFEKIKYTYLADESDARHVAIPNPNRYVRCEEQTAGKCVFTLSGPAELNKGNNNVFVGANSVNINNHIISY